MTVLVARGISVPGVQVQICVDGEPLREYDDPNDEELPYKTLLKYIEAISGAQLSIRFATDRSYPYRNLSLEAEIWLDGKWIETALFSWKDLRDRPIWSDGLAGYCIFDEANKKWFVKAFTFGEMMTCTYKILPAHLYTISA